MNDNSWLCFILVFHSQDINTLHYIVIILRSLFHTLPKQMHTQARSFTTVGAGVTTAFVQKGVQESSIHPDQIKSWQCEQHKSGGIKSFQVRLSLLYVVINEIQIWFSETWPQSEQV